MNDTLNILNIYFGVPLDSSKEKIKNQLEEYFKDNNHILYTEDYVDLTEAVEQFQIKQKVDFLVMVQNEHSFFENLIFNPVIKQMVYHTDVPFMVIPPEEAMES